MDNQVDVRLSDVLLPGGVNGPELAKEAQADSSSLKVISMSGYPSELKRSELNPHVQFLRSPSNDPLWLLPFIRHCTEVELRQRRVHRRRVIIGSTEDLFLE